MSFFQRVEATSEVKPNSVEEAGSTFEYAAVSVKAIHDLNETSIDKSSAEGSSERYKVSSVRDERVADSKMS